MLTTLYFPLIAMKLAINQIFSKTITVETMVGQYALFHIRTLFFINYAKYVINLFQLRSLPHQFTKGQKIVQKG